MTVLTSPDPIVKDFIRALGLDPSVIIDLSIHFRVNDVVVIEVEQYIDKEKLKNLTTEIKRYNLNLIEE